MAKSQVTVRLDKEQLVRARKTLGTDTLTETIQRALAGEMGTRWPSAWMKATRLPHA